MSSLPPRSLSTFAFDNSTTPIQAEPFSLVSLGTSPLKADQTSFRPPPSFSIPPPPPPPSSWIMSSSLSDASPPLDSTRRMNTFGSLDAQERTESLYDLKNQKVLHVSDSLGSEETMIGFPIGMLFLFHLQLFKYVWFQDDSETM